MIDRKTTFALVLALLVESGVSLHEQAGPVTAHGAWSGPEKDRALGEISLVKAPLLLGTRFGVPVDAITTRARR
jgi:hypothetical protein